MDNRFPFGVEWQSAFIKVLIEDQGFAQAIEPFLEAKFFTNDVLCWAYDFMARHKEQYGQYPGEWVLYEQAGRLDNSIRDIYVQGIQMLRSMTVTDANWIRDTAIDFVKRNVFVRAVRDSRELYNSGKAAESFDLMMDAMERISTTHFEPVNESWFFEELPSRQVTRWQLAHRGARIGTGIPDLDKVMDGGLSTRSPSELGIWISWSKVGKALADDEPVLTEVGWREISDLEIGDRVVGGSTGRLQTVTGVFPQGRKLCSKVSFSDGTSLVASNDHLWTVDTKRGRKTVQTRELLGLGARLPLVECQNGKRPDSPLHPYLLGLLIGDGAFKSATVRFHNPEKDLQDAIRELVPEEDKTELVYPKNKCPYVSITSGAPRGVRKSIVAKELERFGLLYKHSRDKFVPEVFKWADPDTRMQVLCGLCDTDGWVIRTGCAIQFSSASECLANDVVFLTRSLGGIATLREKFVNEVCYWVVVLRFPDGRVPVLSKKHLGKTKERTKKVYRTVTSVKSVGDRSCTCISVDDPEGLFVARDFIVTHNTTMLTNHGVVATRAFAQKVAHFVLEGDLEVITARYDTIFSEELYKKVRVGDIDEKTYEMLYAEYQYHRRKLYIRALTDKWEYTVPDLWSVIQDKRSKDGWDPDLIIVDYADLLVGHKRSYTDEYASNADAYKALKTLTTRGKGYGIWTAAQAKKPKDPNYDIKPTLLKSPDVSGRYEKVKVADCLGSINATKQERDQGILRLWIEAVRDNPGGVEIHCPADFERMKFGQGLSAIKAPVEPMEFASNEGAPESNQYSPSLNYQQVRANFSEG